MPKVGTIPVILGLLFLLAASAQEKQGTNEKKETNS
jgi:hypothetical protein